MTYLPSPNLTFACIVTTELTAKNTFSHFTSCANATFNIQQEHLETVVPPNSGSAILRIEIYLHRKSALRDELRIY